MITPNQKRLLGLLNTPKSGAQLAEFMGRNYKDALRSLVRLGLVDREVGIFCDYHLTEDGRHIKRIFKC